MDKKTVEVVEVPSKDDVENIFRHYREKGFPYYSLTPEEKYKGLMKLMRFDHAHLIDGKVIKQTMHGLSLAWSFFPDSWSVRCGSMKTPMEAFQSDVHFRAVIESALKRNKGPVTDSAIRRALRSVRGAQGVSNFRPSAASSLFHRFLPATGGVVWDMAAGFGGRLLGAIACDRVSHYLGTDPCAPTMQGLRRMARELGRHDLKIDLHQVGSETFRPGRNTLDLCFTSPPYFDTEKYSDEATQSYLAYPGRQEWLHGFLGRTLDNCRHGLRRSGHLVLNIANVKSYPTLCEDFLSMAESQGWELVDTLQYSLSKIEGIRRSGGSSFKFEPIYVFKKK